MATLQFIGATQQVTGSCYLVKTRSSQILLDCGMYQGAPMREALNDQPFRFKPADIDAVVLSHAHIDHSGLLPKLVKEGFRGKLYMTPATHDLIDLMLKDAAHLEYKDIEWENKWRRRAGKELKEPLYTLDDVEQALTLRHSLKYDELHNIAADLSVCFHEAGHILGSAIVELRINEKDNHRKLVFSGDLGNSRQALLRDPAVLTGADTLLLESTYGDRLHKSMDDTIEEFKTALDEAAESGGNVLIPSFTIGRTQELLFYLGKFYRQGNLRQQQVFLDSPMAITASDIYQRYMYLFNHEDAATFSRTVKNDWQEWLPILRCTRKTEESMQINMITGGAIIIAASGMCTGGRILHHLKNNLWRSKAHVIIVGLQARNSLGRALVDGASTVKVLGNEIAVKAKIHTLGGFSAHADQSQLLDWAGHFTSPRPELYLVHGELEKMLQLQSCFHRKFRWHANIPDVGEIIQI